MFKTNGEKALLAVCLITIVFISLVFITGVGKEAKATDSQVEPAVLKYFERMPDDHYRMSAGELIPLVESGEDIFLLDIRNASDYEKDHIKGAVNIPFADLGAKLDQIPKDKPIVLYCYTGQNGGQAVAVLNLMGYNAKSLSGGWNGWVSELGKFSNGGAPAAQPADSASCSS